MVPRKMVPLGDDELEGVSGGVGGSVVDPNNPFEVLDDSNGHVLGRKNTYDTKKNDHAE